MNVVAMSTALRELATQLDGNPTLRARLRVATRQTISKLHFDDPNTKAVLLASARDAIIAAVLGPLQTPRRFLPLRPKP